MQEIRIEEKVRIETLSRKFRNAILGNEKPGGNCFTVCYPLSIHLSINNINNSLGTGRYNGTPHSWLNLRDYVSMVVDPTIQQFDENDVDVFVGKITDKPYAPSKDNMQDRLDKDRNGWKERLLQNGFSTSELYENSQRPARTIDSLLLINLTAAALVISEVIQMELKESFVKPSEYDGYYADIQKVLRCNWANNRNLIEDLIPKLPKGFTNIVENTLINAIQ